MSIHDGHRQRLKQRFLEEGLESFTDIQVLELLLFFSVPRQDTNPIAHALLDHFGSLYQVLEAPVEELRKVKGVGEQSALLLSLMNDVARYYQVDRTMREKILPTLRGISCAVLLRTERGNGVSAVSGRQMQGAVLQGGRAGERELSGDIRAEDRGDGLGCQRHHRGSGAQPPQRHRGALQ